LLHLFDGSFDPLALVYGEVIHHYYPSSPPLRGDDGLEVTLNALPFTTHSTPRIPPTDERFCVEHVYRFRLAGGKVAEHWSVWDDLGQMTQLGLIPEP
jgi:hypothetical protein